MISSFIALIFIGALLAPFILYKSGAKREKITFQIEDNPGIKGSIRMTFDIKKQTKQIAKLYKQRKKGQYLILNFDYDYINTKDDVIQKLYSALLASEEVKDKKFIVIHYKNGYKTLDYLVFKDGEFGIQRQTVNNKNVVLINGDRENAIHIQTHIQFPVHGDKKNNIKGEDGTLDIILPETKLNTFHTKVFEFADKCGIAKKLGMKDVE